MLLFPEFEENMFYFLSKSLYKSQQKVGIQCHTEGKRQQKSKHFVKTLKSHRP